MLEVRSVTKKYGKITALDNFSFTLDDGDIVGFIGPNGAGKSTMMKIITGCLAPTEGTALIDGFDIMEDSAAAKERIGYLPEQPPLYPAFTVAEYLSTIFDIKQIKANKKERIAEVCELCGLEEMKKRRIGNLSKGYCQRVGMAQAILAYPPLLVLDEPINGLDPQGIIEMRQLLLNLNQKYGITILVSSHILDELSRLATHYGFIDNGKMVKEISASDLEISFRKSVRIEVTDGKALAEVLEQTGLPYKILTSNVAEVYSRVNISRLTSALEKYQCEVLSIQEWEENLESYYVNLIGGTSHE